jgi:hypothetical protein
MMRVFHVGPLPKSVPTHHKADQLERSVDNCATMAADGCETDSARASISSSSVLGNSLTLKSILMMTMMVAVIASTIVVMDW